MQDPCSLVVGTKTHLRALAGGVVVAEALPAGARPSAVAVGGHGCETPRQCAQISTALRLHFDAPARVVGDAELLLPAAGLVREAARAVWAAHDRGDAPDVLARGLVAALGVVEVPAIGAALERVSDLSAEGGRHAPVVFTAAEGSPLARTVITRAGRAPAALITRLAARGAEVDDVVVAGGTLLAQSTPYEAFTTALTDTAPGSRPHPLRIPPVTGAVTLARTLR
ncbi:ATPase [Streptomyces sp. NPDC017936]|uniref:ATPase n=1 Tax=Streptomyces sp. NPDC017936 TaxID=3365016 RepID=UPI0037B470A5